MYVCVCNAVTETDIKQAVDNGANCLQHLKTELGVSASCGSCACDAKRCLSKALQEQVNAYDLIAC